MMTRSWLELTDKDREKLLQSCESDSCSWHYCFGLLEGMVCRCSENPDELGALQALYDKIKSETSAAPSSRVAGLKQGQK